MVDFLPQAIILLYQPIMAHFQSMVMAVKIVIYTHLFNNFLNLILKNLKLMRI